MRAYVRICAYMCEWFRAHACGLQWYVHKREYIHIYVCGVVVYVCICSSYCTSRQRITLICSQAWVYTYLYVCMHKCIYVRLTSSSRQRITWIFLNKREYMHTHTHTHTHIYRHIYIYIYIYIYTHLYAYIHTYISSGCGCGCSMRMLSVRVNELHIQLIYIYIYIYVCIYIYMSIYIHTYIHTYIRIQCLWWWLCHSSDSMN
jgi:hypothetical protein